MIPVLKIDSRYRRVTLELIDDDDVSQLATLQQIVGGYIEHVYTFANGDMLLVNEDGRTLSPINTRWFRMPEFPEAYAGNGVIIGTADDDGGMMPVKTTADDVASVIQFAEHFR